MKQFSIYLGVAALASALFLVAPEIDLATSRLFYDAKGGFVLSDWPPVVVLYRAVPLISWGMFILVGVGAAWLFLLDRPLWRLDRKALVFLVVSMAVAPGLLANSLLKDHWGRARPVQVEAFGGPHRFTPAPLSAAECGGNSCRGGAAEATRTFRRPGPGPSDSVTDAMCCASHLSVTLFSKITRVTRVTLRL